MAIQLFSKWILKELRKGGYHIFVSQNYPSDVKKVILFPFRDTIKAISYLKTLPGHMNGQLYHEKEVLEEISEGIDFITYYVQIPEEQHEVSYSSR